MRITALALLAALPQLAAATTTICRFETECVEDEPCAGTNYSARIVRMGDGGRGPGVLSDDTGSITLTKLPGPAQMTYFVAGRGEGAYEGDFGMIFLTETPDGPARLTVHYWEGPMAITYLGSCGVAF